MNLRHELGRLAAEFEAENNAAFDLWSWLSSHRVAEKHHGDYAHSVKPPTADIMREAAFVLAEAAGYTHTDGERPEWMECPCGEPHEEAERAHDRR